MMYLLKLKEVAIAESFSVISSRMQCIIKERQSRMIFDFNMITEQQNNKQQNNRATEQQNNRTAGNVSIPVCVAKLLHPHTQAVDFQRLSLSRNICFCLVCLSVLHVCANQLWWTTSRVPWQLIFCMHFCRKTSMEIFNSLSY